VTPSPSRLRRFERRIAAARGLERPCEVCRQLLRVTDGHILALDWRDALHRERPAWFVMLCGRCAGQDFAARLNELHRLRWERTHGRPTPDNLLLR
jgi:hypothetical protein